jgi:hypothetical protein
MKKIKLLFLICILCQICFGQKSDSSLIVFVDTEKDNYVRREKFKKIFKEKIAECKCLKCFSNSAIREVITIDTSQDTIIGTYNAFYDIYRKKSLTKFIPKDSIRFILVSKFDTIRILGDTSMIPGMRIDKIFVLDNPKSNLSFNNYNALGYDDTELLRITYSNFWNKILLKTGLISKMNYYRRLRCIDFENLYKELSQKYP